MTASENLIPDNSHLYLDGKKSSTWVRALLLLFIFSAGLLSEATASHFRFGNLSWSRQKGSNTLKYDFTHGWAYGAGSSYAYLSTNYGGISIPSSLIARPTDGTGLTYDMYHGQGSITYPSSGIFTATYGSCCRIYGLMNGSSGSWSIQSTVNMSYTNNTGSPVSSVPAIVTMQQNQYQATYQIPAYDPDGDRIRFRTIQATGMTSNPFTIDPNTGVLRFNTIGRAVNEKWVCAVVMEDLSPSGQVMSSTMIDFIVEIVTSNSVPPVFNYSTTPANNHVYQVAPGTPVQFNVSANDADPGSTVSLVGIGLPAGSSFNVVNGNPAQGNFSWVPAANQLGAYVISFTAQDNVGLQTQSSVTIVVGLKPRFDVPPTPMAGHHMVYEPGTSINYTIQASDPDPADVVRIISAEAKDANGNWVPLHSGMTTSTLPSTAGNPTSASFNWTPSAADWGHNHIRFVAEDSYGDRTTHEISQLINTNPTFTSTPNTSAVVGSPYSYTISGSDADASQGDQLSFSAVTLPSWLTLTDNGNGTATLTGTPTMADAGTNSVTVQLEDINHHSNTGGIPTQNYNIEVTACQLSASSSGDINALTSTSAVLPAGSANVTINGNNISIYGSGNTYTFQDPVPAGKEIISVDVTYTIYYPYSCCAASNEVHIAGTHVGTRHSSSPAGNKTETYTYTGSLPNYNYGGTNTFKLSSWWNSVRFQNATITFNYGSKGGSCGSNVLVAAPTVNSTCGIASITNDFNNSANASDFYPIGTTQVNWTIVDNNGLTTTAQQNITVTDDELPAILTNDVTVQLDASGNASVSVSDIDNGTTDNCGIASLSLDKTTFDCSNVGGNTVVLTATDVNGNIASATATVTVEDNTAPSVSANNLTIALDDNGSAAITAASINNGSYDNCGIASITISKSSFDCSNVGANTVTLTVTDVNGNVSTTNATVTVEDNMAPALTVVNGSTSMSIPYGRTYGWSNYVYSFNDPTPAGAQITGIDLSFNAVDQGWGGTGAHANFYVSGQYLGNAQLYHYAQNFTINYSGTVPNYNDGGNNNFEMSFVGWSGWVAYLNGGSMTIHYTVGNSAGNTITVQLDANGNASVTPAQIDPGFTDNCGNVNLSLDKTSFDCSNVGSNPVSLTASDDNGNSTTVIGAVIVEDNSAPVVATQNVTVQLDANGNASVTAADINNNSSDNCGIASMQVSKSSFNCSNVGPNTVTLLVTDNNGNVSSANATVTVEDNMAPAALAKDITVQLDANGNASITAADVNNGSSDNCGIASMVVSQMNFDCSHVGANPVTLTVTDVNGNTSTANATVTVEDKVAPNAVAKNVTLQLDANGNASVTAADVNNNSTDACGIASMSLSKTSFDCSNVGGNTVVLTVTDNNGNVSTANATVTVKDNITPTVLTQNITVQLDASGNASVTTADINNGSTDNCGIAGFTLDQTAFDCSHVGSNTVTLTATDVNGNAASATATVTVEDNVAPNALAQDVTVTLSGGAASITAADVNNGSNDACGIASISVSQTAFDCDMIGDNPVVLTVTDNNGNVSTANATVHVVGAIPTPSITSVPTSNVYTGGNPNVIYLGYGAQSVMLQATGGVSYVWASANGLSSHSIANPEFTPTAEGMYTFTVVATNEYGCTAPAEITIQVVDARCGNKKNAKVIVCHKGREICVDENAVPAHLAHGCTIGGCNTTRTNSIAKTETEVTIYPNPFSNQAFIDFEVVKGGSFMVELVDTKGAVIGQIAKGEAAEGSFQSVMIDGSNYATGVYVVRLVTPDAVTYKRIVIQH